MSTIASDQIKVVSLFTLRGQTRPTFNVSIEAPGHAKYDVIVIGIFPAITLFEVHDVLLVSYHDDLGAYSLAKLTKVKDRSYYLLPGLEQLEVEAISQAVCRFLAEAR